MHTTRRHDPRAAKRRDMARSILPSSSRRGARKALQGLRRLDRRRTAQAVRGLRDTRLRIGERADDHDRPLCSCLVTPSPNSSIEDPACPLCELHLPDYPLGEHCHEVWQRRAFDKVAPLIRWAGHEVEGMALGDALGHLWSIVPAGVIGRHAMSHLIWPLGLDEKPVARQSVESPRVEARLALLSIGAWALEHGHHRELNAKVHRHLGHPEPVVDASGRHRRRSRVGSSWNRARPLLGVHDLADWSATLAPAPDRRTLGWGDVVRTGHRWPRDLARLAAWAEGKGWHDPSLC